jgi:hypothetical protein
MFPKEGSKYQDWKLLQRLTISLQVFVYTALNGLYKVFYFYFFPLLVFVVVFILGDNKPADEEVTEERMKTVNFETLGIYFDAPRLT